MKKTKTIWLLSIVSMFADMAGEMFYTLTPIYMQHIGISIAAIGTLEGVAEFIAGFSKGYFGNWSDAIQKRIPFIKIGYLMSAISKPLIVVSNTLGWIFAMRSIDRLGKGIRSAARDAMLSNEATPSTKSRVFAFHRAWDTVGAIVGPAIVVVILFYNLLSIKQIFLLGLIPGVLSVLFIFFIKEKKAVTPILKKRPGFFSYFSYWKKSSLLYKKITIAICIFFLFNSSDVFLILKSKEIIQSENKIYIVLLAYIVYNIVYAISSYPLGKIADLFSKQFVIAFGLIIFAFVYIGFAFATQVWHVFVLFAVYGLFAAATEGVVKAWISNTVDKNEQATGLGLFASLQSLTIMLASIFAGLLWEYGGSRAVFITSGSVAAGVAGWFLVNKHLTTSEKNNF